MFLLAATSASTRSAGNVEQAVGGDGSLNDPDVQEFDRFLRRGEIPGERLVQDGRTFKERAAASLDRYSAEESGVGEETAGRQLKAQRRLGGRRRGMKPRLQGIDKMFRPGLKWLDKKGRSIEAHGGSVIYVKEERKWYWYGEDKEGETYLLPGSLARIDFRGIACYSSSDLLSWTSHGLCLPANTSDPSSPLHPSQVAERPRVLFHSPSGRYVMWFHSDDAMYEAAAVGVAVSQQPQGPFTFIGRFRPHGHESRDFTLFQDEDGSAFLLSASEMNAVMHIARLSPDYLTVDGPFVRRLVGKSREAPAVFKYNQVYYMVTSACTGWYPNRALLHSAPHPMAEWTVIGDLCPSLSDVPDISSSSSIPQLSLRSSIHRTANACATTFGSQATAVLTLPAPAFLPPTFLPPTFTSSPTGLPPNLFILLADRWRPNNLADSRYVWLPLLLLGAGREGEGEGNRGERRGQKDMGNGARGFWSRSSTSDGERGVRAVMLWRDEWSINEFVIARHGSNPYKHFATNMSYFF